MRWVAAAIVVALAGAGCAGDSSSIAAPAAADAVVQGLGLPNDVTPCLVSELDDSVPARRVFDPELTPSSADYDALSAVVAVCVPADTFAASVSVLMANGYRPVADVTPEKERCLRDRMAELSGEERGLFATGQISQLRDPTSDRALEITDLLHRLLDACDIVVGTATTTVPAPGP